MNKTVKSIFAIVLICITCISLVGCFLPKNQELFVNGQVGGDVLPAIYMWIKGDNTVIPTTSDITIMVLFGHGRYDEVVVSAKAIVKMKISFYNKDTDSFYVAQETTLMEIEDFVDSKYQWSNTKKEDSPDGKKNVVIKNELLTQDSGCISFITNATVKHIADGEEKESPENGSVAVYYIKKDEKIYLFDDTFKFKKARNFYGY